MTTAALTDGCRAGAARRRERRWRAKLLDSRRPPHRPDAAVYVRPRPLAPGDLVRVISPQFPALAHAPKRRARAEQALRQLGLRVDYGRHAFAAWGHLARRPDERAADVNEAFADPHVAGIVCALGGCGVFDVLPLLDYEVIARNPKVFRRSSISSVNFQSRSVRRSSAFGARAWGREPSLFAR